MEVTADDYLDRIEGDSETSDHQHQLRPITAQEPGAAIHSHETLRVSSPGC